MPDNYEPQPDYFFPSAFSLGPDGNISSIQSSDYIAGGVRGFKLYDSVGAQDNPEWIVSDGGLDANSLIVARLVHVSFMSVLDFVDYVPTTTEIVNVEISNSPPVVWRMQALSVTPDGGGNLDIVWAFLGGAPLSAVTAGTTSIGGGGSAAYPGTPQGPSQSIPVDGTYDIRVGCLMGHNFAGAAFVAFAWGQAAATQERAPVVGPGTAPMGEWEANAVACTAGTVSWWGRSPSSTPGTPITANFNQRYIRVIPQTLTTTVPAP